MKSSPNLISEYISLNKYVTQATLPQIFLHFDELIH